MSRLFITFVALLTMVNVTSAQESGTYGKCVDIPAGSESSYLLGGRHEFYDAIRWTFQWDSSIADGVGRLDVETRTKAEFGSRWLTSVSYRTIRAGTADDGGIRSITYDGGRVRAEIWDSGNVFGNLIVNVPGRLKFSSSGDTSSLNHNACP